MITLRQPHKICLSNQIGHGVWTVKLVTIVAMFTRQLNFNKSDKEMG